jgi:hypothetical protein
VTILGAQRFDGYASSSPTAQPAAVNNRYTDYITQEERRGQPFSEASGEMTALDVATGEVKWARELDAPRSERRRW